MKNCFKKSGNGALTYDLSDEKGYDNHYRKDSLEMTTHYRDGSSEQLVRTQRYK